MAAYSLDRSSVRRLRLTVSDLSPRRSTASLCEHLAQLCSMLEEVYYKSDIRIVTEWRTDQLLPGIRTMHQAIKSQIL
jgi:hypothetical protein